MKKDLQTMHEFSATRLSLEDIAHYYPKLFSEKKLSQWAQLFGEEAMLIRVERGVPTTSFSLEEAMPEQIEYAEENEFFLEEWDNVEISAYGSIAVIKADYRLTVDCEIREGVDLLTLVNEGQGWKISTLAYEQTRLIRK